MKANELFIGAHVEALGKNRKIKSIVVKDTDVEVSFYGSNPVIVSLDMLRPIPLTMEILEKNEWCSRMNGTGEFYLKKPLVDAAIVTKNIIGFQMNHGPFSKLPIHYAHQLQHALRLCGVEKEIVL